MKRTFEDSSGLTGNEDAWNQASLSVSRGGIGLRKCSKHAAAAYLSSRVATKDLCTTIDPEFTWDATCPELQHGMSLFNETVPPDKHLTNENIAAIDQTEDFVGVSLMALNLIVCMIEVRRLIEHACCPFLTNTPQAG